MVSHLILLHGEVALVDNDCLPRLTSYTWYLTNNGYVRATIDKHRVYLHRFLMNAGPGQLVDHRDGDPLNNTLENLRIATRSQNQQNKRSTSASGFKGVTFDKGKWLVRIQIPGEKLSLGAYDDLKTAALVYDAAARYYFGEFAWTNFTLEEMTDEACVAFDAFLNPPPPIPKQKSKYRGVYWDKGRWRAKIGVNGRSLHLGYFREEEEAARVYDENAKLLHGDQAILNF